MNNNYETINNHYEEFCTQLQKHQSLESMRAIIDEDNIILKANTPVRRSPIHFQRFAFLLILFAVVKFFVDVFTEPPDVELAYEITFIIVDVAIFASAFILFGILRVVYKRISAKRDSIYFAEMEQYENYAVAERNKIKEKEEIAAQLEDEIGQWKFLPAKYNNAETLSRLILYFESRRAVTTQEAVNLFEADVQMEEQNRLLGANIEASNRAANAAYAAASAAQSQTDGQVAVAQEIKKLRKEVHGASKKL